MKYRFSLNVPDTRKCIEEDISLLLFSENEPRDTLSYIKNPLLKKKMLVTYKYIKRNEKHGNVCTSAKSYAKLNFMRINEQQTEVSADVISKRKKFSFSDMLLLLISIGVATVTFFVSLAFIFGRMSVCSLRSFVFLRVDIQRLCSLVNNGLTNPKKTRPRESKHFLRNCSKMSNSAKR